MQIAEKKAKRSQKKQKSRKESRKIEENREKLAKIAENRGKNRKESQENHEKIAERTAKNQGKSRKNRPSVYLRHHRRDIDQTFMVHSPNDALQTHKVSGQNSPRGRVGGQKSLKNPETPEKSSPGRGGGDGRPLWDMTTYLHQHRQDITQTFMEDSPSNNLQMNKPFVHL